MEKKEGNKLLTSDDDGIDTVDDSNIYRSSDRISNVKIKFSTYSRKQ